MCVVNVLCVLWSLMLLFLILLSGKWLVNNRGLSIYKYSLLVYLNLYAYYCQFFLRGRLRTMNIESVMEDLMYCCHMTKQKIQKRLRRLKFLLDVFKSNLTLPFINKVEECIQTYKDDADMSTSFDLENINLNVFNKSKSVLFECSDFMINAITNPSSLFISTVTKIINDTGFTYDVNTMIAIIAYHRLMISNMTEMEKAFLKNSYLVFKGGASVAKFSIKNLNLNDSQKYELIELFQKGGDNDTSLILSVAKEFNEYDTLNTYRNICAKLTSLIETVSIEFNVFSLLEGEFSKADKHSTLLLGETFNFNMVKAHSFVNVPCTIVNQTRTVKSMCQTSIKAKHIYSTLNDHVDFLTTNQKRCSFFLVRLKLAFCVHWLSQNKSSGIGAELLDVSIPLPWSDHSLNASYNTIQPVIMYF